MRIDYQCECGSVTLDHKHDCPLYAPVEVPANAAQMETERYKLRESVSSESMRKRVVTQLNGSGSLPR